MMESGCVKNIYVIPMILPMADQTKGIVVHPAQSKERIGDEYQRWANIDTPGDQHQLPSRHTLYGEPQDNQVKAKESASVLTLGYLSTCDLNDNNEGHVKLKLRR